MESKKTIFISYKRVDKDLVLPIVEKINARYGDVCWMDLEGIESNGQFATKICDAIKDSEIVLFMYSKTHKKIDLEKDWTMRELRFAYDTQRKEVLLVNLDKTDLYDVFDMYFGTTNWIDATDPDAIEKMIRDLRKKLMPMTSFNLKIKTNEDCEVFVDDESKGRALASKMMIISLSKGEYEVVGESEKERIEKEVKVADGDVLVKFEFQGEKMQENVSSGNGVSGGVFSGWFSVSQDEKIRFSPGNLQYQASTGLWRFAEHQYDIIDSGNRKISENYDGWIDLFGWGTSGYNGCMPYEHSKDKSDYAPSRDITGTAYDWGIRDKIGNYERGTWRTLTQGEWCYLYSVREDASSLRGAATVVGVEGYVFLPDDWTMPSGATFTADSTDFTTNQYSADEWSVMEEAGAVFLPAAGYRDGASVCNVGTNGYYRSSMSYNAGNVYSFYFDSSEVDAGYYYSIPSHGYSVRLVQENF